MGKAKIEKSKPTDNELVQHYREGDANSFKVLFERYQGTVFGYIFSLVKDKEIANEIFEHTFYKVIYTIKRDQYNFESEFSPWVLRTAQRLIKSYFRYKKIINQTVGQGNNNCLHRKYIGE